MFVIGLTGTIGSGKSTVTELLKEQGAKAIDCDKIVHELYSKDKKARKGIKELFGAKVFKNKSIDRSRIAENVFSDKKILKKLNALIHPLVEKNVLQELKKTKKGMVVIDAPLLFEAGFDRFCDLLIFVRCGKTERLKRLKKKGMYPKEAERREIVGLPEKKKISLCDGIIDTSRGLDKTKKQVGALLCNLRALEMIE